MQNIENILDTLHLEDLNNEAHPSIFDDNENYNMFIIRLPIIGENLDSKSFGFILTDQKSYYYDKEKKEFKEFDNEFTSVYKMVDKAVDRVLRSFTKFQDMVSDLEEDLYANNTDKDFLNSWLEIKLQILRVERILARTTNIMDEFIGFYKDNEEFPINKYIDIHEHLDRIMRSALLQLSKLDYLYSFYNAKSNDKMNKMIEESQSIVDKKVLSKKWKEMFKMIVEDNPYLFLYIPNSITVINKNIKNVENSPSGIWHNYIKWEK